MPASSSPLTPPATSRATRSASWAGASSARASPSLSPSPPRSKRALLPSQLQVLVGREVEAGNGGGEDVVHARPHPGGEAQVIDGHLRHLLLEDALHLEEERLALLPVQLLGLAAEDVVDLGQRAESEGAVLGHEGFEPGGRVARDAADGEHHAMELLLAPRRHEGAAFHGAHARADAHRLQPAADGLGHGVVGREGREVARVEAVREARLGKELLRALGIESRRIDGWVGVVPWTDVLRCWDRSVPAILLDAGLSSESGSRASLSHGQLVSQIPRLAPLVALHRAGRRWPRPLLGGRAHGGGRPAPGCPRRRPRLRLRAGRVPRGDGALDGDAPASRHWLPCLSRSGASDPRRQRRAHARAQSRPRRLHGAPHSAPGMDPRSRPRSGPCPGDRDHRARYGVGGLVAEVGARGAGAYGTTRRAGGLERHRLQQSARSATLGAQDLRLRHHAQLRPSPSVGSCWAPSSFSRWAPPPWESSPPSAAEVMRASFDGPRAIWQSLAAMPASPQDPKDATAVTHVLNRAVLDTLPF